jgi:hypothetical protein
MPAVEPRSDKLRPVDLTARERIEAHSVILALLQPLHRVIPPRRLHQ